MKRIHISFFAYSCFFAITIPLLIIVIALFRYTVLQNSQKYEDHLNNIASSVVSSAEKQIKTAHSFLNETSVSMEYLFFGYAMKKDRLYSYAAKMDQELSKAFFNVPTSKGFLFYNSYTDYFYADYHGTLSSTFREELCSLLDGNVSEKESLYISLPSLDPSCCLLIIRHQYGNIIAVLDLNNDPLFRASTADFNGKLSYSNAGQTSEELIEVPLAGYPVSLYYEVPRESILQQMDQTQAILLFLIVVLILFIPMVWLIFNRYFSRPLKSLVSAFSIVSQGDLSYRIHEQGIIEELELYRSGFNKMMDAVEEGKATSLQWERKSYHQQLDIMQAQLQYLQLQARPHFYLNCLKNVDSLLKLEKTEEAHELILAFSSYLRHIFRDIRSFISLREELQATEKYVDLCKHLSRNSSLFLNLDNDCLSCKVLPMSILTFVENCIKHGSADDDLEISITAMPVQKADGTYLSVTIENDGGPFEQSILDHLNSQDSSEVKYQSMQVGISNVRYRLWLVYGERASLVFRNDDCCAVVDMLLPYEMEEHHELDDRG